MTATKNTTNQHNYQLPDGNTIVRLQDVGADEQEKLMGQVFELLEENYPGFAKSENKDVWLSRLYEDGKAGTNTMVSAVLDKEGKVVGATAMDRYDEKIGGGSVLMSYSLGHKPTAEHPNPDYLAILHASKADALANIHDLQKSGVNIPAVFQEHIVGKDSHAQKIEAGYALGQVPFTGSPTSLVSQDDKYKIMVFTAEGPANASPAMIEKMKEGATKANLFLADITPSDPSKPLAETLRQFAAGYAQNNSYFKDHPEQDPGYQSLMNIADKLPQQATYRQAYDAAAVGAAQYMKLDPGMAPPTMTKEQIAEFASRSDAQKEAALLAVSKDHELAHAYGKGEKLPSLDAAYNAKNIFEEKLNAAGANPVLIKAQLSNFDAMMIANIERGNLDNIAAATKHGHVLPERQELTAEAQLEMAR
ncbi:MAG TPA: hypothetical protein VIO56_03500 [Methylotenera sp.]